jgi:hypothetical protein
MRQLLLFFFVIGTPALLWTGIFLEKSEREIGNYFFAVLMTLISLYVFYRMWKTSKTDRRRTVDGRNASPFNEVFLLTGMYRNNRFPYFLTDRIKALLVDLIVYIHADVRTYKEIKGQLDKITDAINDMQKDFRRNGCDLHPSLTHNAILNSLRTILQHFDIDIDVDAATAMRKWEKRDA